MVLAATHLGVDYGSTFKQTTVDIAANASSLAAGLTGGVTITATLSDFGWAVPPAGALIAATMTSDATHAALFAYPAGPRRSACPPPTSRVGFAIREMAAANLTADGLTLFDNAVSFALSN